MKKEMAVKWIRGIVSAYLFSAAALLILAFIMYRYEVSDGVIRGGILAAYVISCFLGGSIVSRAYSAKRYLWGLLTGLLYFLILWVVSMLGNREMFSGFPTVLPTMFLCVFGGMLGGMFRAGKQ